jgi:FkbM family methyltransferase
MDKILEFIDRNDIRSVLDIGANVGNYSRTIKYFFPDIRIMMIEANPHCEEHLKNTGIDYMITCLSDVEKEIDFYLQDDNDIGTGSSYYLENTNHYSLKRSMRTKTNTLDNIIGNQKFDMIKIDTQGSEIDIIRGGSSVVDQAKFVCLEISLTEYNENAPLKDEVMSFMNTQNFHPIELVEEHFAKGNLIQEDWIFAKKS